MLKLWHGSCIKIPSYSHFKQVLNIPRPQPTEMSSALNLNGGHFLICKRELLRGWGEVMRVPAHLPGSSVIIFPTAAPAQPSSAIIAREVQARLSALWASGWPQVALETHPWQGTVVPSCLSEAWVSELGAQLPQGLLDGVGAVMLLTSYEAPGTALRLHLPTSLESQMEKRWKPGMLPF